MPFAALVRNLIPWFVTRQVFTGAGKVGSENGADACDYQISQRADFFEEEVGLETTLKRPIVNTRDEPHADPQKYRRLHVIVGDANLCEVATFLKVGTTAIVLAMIEDGFIDKDLSISRPVAAIRTVSHDPTLQATVDAARRRSLHRGRAAVGVPAPGPEVRRRDRPRACGGEDDRRPRARPLGSGARRPRVATRWSSTASSTGSRSSALLRAYVDRDDLRWNDPKLSLLDLQYHDVRPERSLYEKLVRAGQDRTAARRGRRARPRWPIPPRPPGRISGARASRWADSVVAANWDSLVLDVGIDPFGGSR